MTGYEARKFITSPVRGVNAASKAASETAPGTTQIIFTLVLSVTTPQASTGRRVTEAPSARARYSSVFRT